MKKLNGSLHRIWYDEPVLWAKEQESRVEKECKFLDSIFKKYKVNKILDVGCGAGSHCAFIKKLGYLPTGIDLNRNLIKYAQSHFPGIKFYVGDQRNYKLNEKFDAVYTLCTVISLAVTNEDLFNTLKSHNHALKKGGILIIDTFNPVIFIGKEKYLHERRDKENSLGCYSMRKYSVDENRQLSIDEATFYDSKTGKIISSDRSEKRMTFPQEIKFFLENAGFKVISFYGGFELNHKSLNGHRMIVLAQKVK